MPTISRLDSSPGGGRMPGLENPPETLTFRVGVHESKFGRCISLTVQKIIFALPIKCGSEPRSLRYFVFYTPYTLVFSWTLGLLIKKNRFAWCF
jgi:hypothetical protein